MSTSQPRLHSSSGSPSGSLPVGQPRLATTTQQQSMGDKESTAIDDRRSEISGAGYSAYSGHRASETHDYHMRLVRFYQRYNPEKIPRVAEFLEAYKGDEEELFRTLREKYGPEPEPSIISAGSGPTRPVGVAHVPRVVSPEDGNCDRETPYYPGQRTIMESDLCNLLKTKKTEHPDLLSVFVGVLPAHPAGAWNGETYITNVPVPIDEQSRFLGHLWAGSLSNTKTIVHDKIAYTRTVFHCNDQCSSHDFPHERWRLTLIRSDTMEDTLYRVLWDPVLSPAAAAELLKSAPNAVEQDRSFFSSFFRKSKNATGGSMPPVPPPPAKLPSQPGGGGGAGSGQLPPAYPPPMTLAPPTASSPLIPMQPTAGNNKSASPNAHGGGGSGTGGPGSSAFQQPQQPQLVSTIDTLINLVQGLEGRLTERISDLDRRLQAVEQDVVMLKEMNEQRQVEQLPEPWLEDEGGGDGGDRGNRPTRNSSSQPNSQRSAKEQAERAARLRRKAHRRRVEKSRQRMGDGEGGDDHDGTETIQTGTSYGTSVGNRSSGYG